METLTLYKSPYPKKRIGKNNDGGYVTVELPDNDYDLFLSGGISNDNTFENELLKMHPKLTCYAFDGTIPGLPQKNDRIQFVRKNLASYNSDYVTNLHEYMEDYENIFLKIDIEGHEFRLLPTFFENEYIKKIKQLVVEIHSPADIQLYPDYFRGLSDIKNEHMFDLLRKLNNTHTLVHLHANNGCKMNVIDGINIPHVFELTYIRNDYVSKRVLNNEPLPTSLDMKNIPHLPDHQLKGFPYST
jgi:hypothetical protein